MSCIVLDNELADKNVKKEWEFFLNEMLRDPHFVLQTNTNPRSKQFGVQEICTKLCETVNVLDYRELPKTLPVDVKDEYSARRPEICELPAIFLDKEVENLDDHGCSKVQDLFGKKKWICPRYPFRQKTTLQCSKCKAKLLGNWILHHINF